MKTINKLLPLLGIATVATAITPFVASCGSTKTTASVTWDYSDGIFEYTTDRLASGSLSEPDATKTYFEAAAKDANIFAEDVANKMASLQWQPIAEENPLNVVPLHVEVSASNISYENKVGYATFKVAFDGLTDIYKQDTFDTYANGVAEFNHVPLTLVNKDYGSPIGYHHVWDAEPVEDEKYWTNWSVSVTTNIPSTGLTFSATYDTDEEMFTAGTILYSVSPDYCYYLGYVSLKSA